MPYSSVSRLRQLTNFKKELVTDKDVLAFIPLADRITRNVISTRHHLEKMDGSIDGSNKFFRARNVPLIDMNLQNQIVLDNCEVAANWTKGADGATPTLGGRLTQGAAAVRLGKDGTAAVISTFSQTIASAVDGTRKRLRVDIFIQDRYELAKSNALTFRIGNDASNYYEVTFNRDKLISGLNEIDIDLTKMGVTLAPDITALDFLYIAFNTTNVGDTIAVGNIQIDHWRLDNSLDLDITDVDVYYATLDTDNSIVYGSVQTLTAVERREGRVTVTTAPTTTTAACGIYATYRSAVENIDYDLVKDSATYVLAHLCSFKIAGNSADFQSVEDAFLRRDIAGAPDEWMRLAISTINLALGSRQIGLRVVETKDVLH